MYDTQAILNGFTGKDAIIPKLSETENIEGNASSGNGSDSFDESASGGNSNGNDGNGNGPRSEYMTMRGVDYKAVSRRILVISCFYH